MGMASRPLPSPSLLVCESPRVGAFETNATRPFTAAGARTTSLLAVHVLSGENVGASDTSSSFVALHLRRMDSAVNEPSLRMVNAGDEDAEAVYYDVRSSSFAVTRVSERTTVPVWNELLILSLPVDWRTRTDAAKTVLTLDVVQRDASQQEDALIATADLPLASILHDQVQNQLALEFPPTTSSASQALRVFLTISETVQSLSSERVVDLLVQSFTPQVDTKATLVVLIAADSDAPAPDPLASIFHRARDVNESSSQRAITPSARKQTGSSVFRWDFPVVFHHSQASFASKYHVVMYSAAVNHLGPTGFSPFGRGVLELDTIPSEGLPISFDITIRAIQPLGSVVDPPASTPLGQLQIKVRCWDRPAWEQFQHDTMLHRRIVSTNRRDQKRAELQALEWTGALCRGLNRYPISSFCDEGGLTSLLATYLATPSSTVSPAPESPPKKAIDESKDHLNQHVRLLQQEVMAKQQTIQKMEAELVARLNAVQTCGAELMSTRRELRAKDTMIAELQQRLKTHEQREARETQELLAASQSGLRMDHPAAQRMNLLVVKFRELEHQHQSTKLALDDAKRANAVYSDLEKKYRELEQAHMIQAALVQRLQNEKTQASDMQRVVRLQEKVIRKFEKTVSLQSHKSNESGPMSTTTMATNQQTPAHEIPDNADRSFMSVRVQVLENQLRLNAKAAGSEISRLKMRIMELESQMHPCGSTDPT